MRRKEAKNLLTTIRERYRVMYDADHENRSEALEDMKFVNVPGEQWEANMKQERGQRPCYEFNKVRVRCKRIVNDMRDNRPHGKVRPVEGGDKDIAEIYEGLIRNIWNSSHGDNATDYAAEYQVEGGMGAWRITTDYTDDSAFEQDIMIEMIENPFCLYADPSAKDFMKRDAEDWLLTERISHKAFEAKYGDAEKSDFETEGFFDDEDDWLDDQSVRIAEYWYKQPHKKELWMLEDGTVVDSESDEARGIPQEAISRRREVMTHKIMWCIASGQRILEGPTEWAGRKFPFVMVYGEYKVIDGKKRWWGLARFAKDAQRSYNIDRTAAAEAVAMAPKEYFWATPTQAEGLTDQWSVAHKKNLPFKLYNPDAKAPGPPVRIGGANVPVALIQQSGIDNEDIKDVMGLPDSSMGQESGEKSGRAIYARQQQGEIATFNYKDNMAKAIELTYEILIDLIPEIYDTERELRVLGSDGADSYKRVNQLVLDPATGNVVRVNDLSMGKYDVTITVGPAFSTLRQEAAETYGELGQRFPQLMEVAGDLVFKSMDLPYAEDIADRLRTLLPPPIQKLIEQGADIPPEIQQAMQQADMAMAQVQEQGQLVQAAAAELEQAKADNDKIKAEIKTELANVRAAKAEFDAHIAKEAARLIKDEAGLTKAGAQLTKEEAELTALQARMDSGDIEVDEVKYRELIEKAQAVDSLDEVMAQFMQSVQSALQNIEQTAAELNRKTERRPVGGTTRRENGRLIADVEFDDGTVRSISAVNDKGQLRIVNPDAEG